MRHAWFLFGTAVTIPACAWMRDFCAASLLAHTLRENMTATLETPIQRIRATRSPDFPHNAHELMNNFTKKSGPHRDSGAVGNAAQIQSHRKAPLK
jgi:hypothetical protein